MRSISDKKESKHGIFFTPEKVADFMSFFLKKDVQENEKKSFKILDPSCGTGNLLASIKQYFAESTVFGVELDAEFSKIAQKNFPETVQGDFLEWQAENPVDLIISNPPYFNVRNLSQDQRDVYKKKFQSYDGNGDILNLFIEQAMNQLKDDGYAICIVQRYFLETEHKGLREFLLQYSIIDIIDFKQERLFVESGCNAETCIIHLQKRKASKKHTIRVHEGVAYAHELLNGKMPKANKYKKVSQGSLNGERWIFDEIADAAQITSDIVLGDVCKIGVGYLTSADKAYEVSKEDLRRIEPEVVKKVIKNKDITENGIQSPETFWICPYEKELEQYPKAHKYLQEYKEKLEKRPFSMKNKKWYDYKGYQNPDITEAKEKIVFRSFGAKPHFAVCDLKNSIYSNNVNGLIIKPEYRQKITLQKLETYLNSPEVFGYMKGRLLKQKASGYDFKPNALRNIPITKDLLD